MRRHTKPSERWPAAAEKAGTSSYDGYDLLRAAARREFIALPAVLRGWLDLSEKHHAR
jgi:hypothetical protein